MLEYSFNILRPAGEDSSYYNIIPDGILHSIIKLDVMLMLGDVLLMSVILHVHI